MGQEVIKMEENKQTVEGQEQDQQQEVKTFTQEDIDNMQKDWEKKLQAETDRRVNQALEKKQAEFQQKLESEKSEAQRLASMSAEEKKQEELSKKEKELAERESKIKRLELESQTKTEMATQGLPVEFTSYVMADDAETIKANIGEFKTAWEQAIEKAVEDKLKGHTPKTATKQSGLSITKEQFAKMTYAQKMDIYNADPELYKSLKG